ncbi:MAG: hypothetical protein ABUS49_10160 [Acidobacteriota bacterium]
MLLLTVGVLLLLKTTNTKKASEILLESDALIRRSMLSADGLDHIPQKAVTGAKKTCHESIETTHRYIEADLRMKERALKKLTPAQGHSSRFQAGDERRRFLAAL